MVHAMVLKEGGPTFFNRIVLEHNHKLTHSPRMTKHMRIQKQHDPGLLNLMDIMHISKVKQNSIMSMLKNSIGGSKNLNLTKRDIKNR